MYRSNLMYWKLCISEAVQRAQVFRFFVQEDQTMEDATDKNQQACEEREHKHKPSVEISVVFLF